MNASKFQKVTAVVSFAIGLGLTLAALNGQKWAEMIFLWSFRFVELEITLGGLAAIWGVYKHPEKTKALAKAFWQGFYQGLDIQNAILFSGVSKTTRMVVLTSLYAATGFIGWKLLPGFEAVLATGLTLMFFVMTVSRFGQIPDKS